MKWFALLLNPSSLGNVLQAVWGIVWGMIWNAKNEMAGITD
jgi:hypothetical protein